MKKGRLKLAEKGYMTLDTNPFGLSINMVLVFVSQKKMKGGKIPRWERKLKVNDKARSSQKIKMIWRAKTMKSQETRR